MAAFGGMIASSVVKEVMAKLASKLWEQIGLHCDFKEDMEDMMRNLKMIQSVLDTAERKSVMDQSVCEWLQEIKSAAYDIEDMMCDFETMIPLNSKDGGLVDWLRTNILSRTKKGKKRIDLVEQMKKMRKRLSNIGKRRQLIMKIENNFDKAVVVKDRDTSSYLMENVIFGRDKENEELINLLIQPNDGEEASIIAIVGFGGIGKTTLAGLIFNDARVKETFSILRAWVYVSINFDLVNIGKAILKSFGHEVSGPLEEISRSLKHNISGNKYFIVLDDLWEENGVNLRKLRYMLRGGMNGSKIVITTRSEKVAKLIGAAETGTHKIKVLSDHFCWELFSEKAFPSLSDKNDKDLEVIRRKIVKMCGGIPLAVIAVGDTVRVNGIDALLEVQDNKIWKLMEPSDGSSNGIMSSLKLSYYFMSSSLKLCFAYCSILPKGVSLLKEELIQQWIALGFIPTDDGISLKIRGEWYVNDLLRMSFLQSHTSYYTSNVELKMHDVVHDLARSVIGNELLVWDAKKNDTNIDDHYRYAFFPHFEGRTIAGHTMFSKLRAVYWDSYTKSDDAKENKIDFVEHAKYLRVLYLSPSYRSTTIPNSIGMLKQLRYLCARYNELSDLPRSFEGLINLRYLCMSENRFENLPVSLRNLTNLEVLILNSCMELECLPEPLNLVSLRELYLQNCWKLRKMPDSISNLTKLEILDVSDCKNLSITRSFLCIIANAKLKLNMKGSLYPMSSDSLRRTPTNFFLARTDILGNYFPIDLDGDQLEGINSSYLWIECFENVNDPKNVANANLRKKTCLSYVTVTWRHPNSPSIEEMSRDEAILEYIKLPMSITTLELDGYSARKFPSWLMNIHDFLSNISLLTLANMKNCEHLPPLGLLPKLSNLTLLNMPNLKTIDEEFIGKSRDSYDRIGLSLISLLNLEEWLIGDATFGDMYIDDCPKLRFEPHFPMSRTCCIERSPQVFYPRSSKNQFHFRLPTHSLKITQCSSVTFPNIDHQCPKSLKYLIISSCKNLEEIPSWLAELTSLRILYIRNCNSLNNFPLFLLELPSIKLICIESSNPAILDQCSKDNRLIVDDWKYEDEDEDENPTLSRCWRYLNNKLDIVNIDAGIGNSDDEGYKYILLERIPPQWNEGDYESSNGDYETEEASDSNVERDEDNKFGNSVTCINQDPHVSAQHSSDQFKRKFTAEEKGKGPLKESDKNKSRVVEGLAGDFMRDAHRQPATELPNQISPNFNPAPNPPTQVESTTVTPFKVSGASVKVNTTVFDKEAENKDFQNKPKLSHGAGMRPAVQLEKESSKPLAGNSSFRDSDLYVVLRKTQSCILPRELGFSFPSIQKTLTKLEGYMKETKKILLLLQSFITSAQHCNSVSLKAWLDETMKIAKNVVMLIEEYASLVGKTEKQTSNDGSNESCDAQSWSQLSKKYKEITLGLQKRLDMKDSIPLVVEKESSWSYNEGEKDEDDLNLRVSNLPSHLKNCFLYCSLFPESSYIIRKDITKLWVAEGFIKEGGTDKTMEELADQYLLELVSRSLLHVAKCRRDGQPKTLVMNNFVREFALNTSVKERFGAILGDSYANELADGTRRVSISNCSGNMITIPTEVSQKLRSFLLFSQDVPDGFIDNILSSYYSENKNIPSSSMLLRVLCLQRAGIEVLPDSVCKLFNLRYLDLRCSHIKRIPEFLGNLHSLEVLDLGCREPVLLPPGALAKLHKLRHLHVNFPDFPSALDISYADFLSDVCALQNLQTLKTIVLIEKMASQLGKLIKLRSLSIATTEPGSNAWDILCSLSQLSNLTSLKIFNHCGVCVELAKSKSFPKLEKIHFVGPVNVASTPFQSDNLQKLQFLKMENSEIQTDPLPYISSFPNLVELYLRDAYQGNDLTFKQGWFPTLKILTISGMDQLVFINIEEGTMKNLYSLTLCCLKNLKELPKGIMYLNSLNELFIEKVPQFLIEISNSKGNSDFRQRIPKVYIK